MIDRHHDEIPYHNGTHTLLQFPASVDYLLTLEDVGLSLPGLVPEEGRRYSFTLDTTASVNLITKEVGGWIVRVIGWVLG